MSLPRIRGGSTLATLAEAIGSTRYSLVSTDLFDTVLLRDLTTESGRLAAASRRAARRLDVDGAVLTQLRWSFQASAYQAVALTRPHGEATLAQICRSMATALGLDQAAADLLHQTEVEVDCEHLRPNRRLLSLLQDASEGGARVVAVSDTYYDGTDLEWMLKTVVGEHPIAAVYSSADLGLTKHAGRIFDEVARRELVSAAAVLHIGDSRTADIEMAGAASWGTVHLPRTRRHRTARLVGKSLALPAALRRAR